ncbi:MAG: hypothetical protein WAM14_08000 [Candidatus Nitrosopolaris sp.]
MKVSTNLNSIVDEINTEYIVLIKENVKWEETLDLDKKYEIKIRKPITN